MSNTYPEVRALIKAMVTKGYVVRVHDGEELHPAMNTSAAAMEIVLSVDESGLNFQKEDHKNIWAGVILGNGKGEAIFDHSDRPEIEWFDELVTELYNKYS